MLALLLARAEVVVTVDQLVEELWEGEPPPSAVANVRMYAARLRHILAAHHGGPALAKVGGGYRLSIGAADYDLSAFRGLVGEARAALDGGDLEAAESLFDNALELRRGPPLADLTLGPGLTGWRTAIEEELLSAVEDRADAELRLGAHDRACTELPPVLAAYPLRERCHALLARARYQAGDVAGALAALTRARQILADELGIEPGEELSALQTAVLNRDPSLALPERVVRVAAGEPRPGAALVPRQLPADVPHFAGRGDYLRRLDGLLADADRSPATVLISAIAGTAGVGKTALALHWAHHIADRFPDGQLYINLRGFGPGPVLPAAEAVRGFLDSLGVPPERVPTSADAQSGQYRSLLADRRMLVVLDNALDADQVRPLLPGNRRCLVIVTSRSQLGSLVAVDGASALRLDVLSTAEALELLTRRCGPARTGAERAAAGQIIEACAHLPLALNIVAARAQQTGRSLVALAAELANDARRLDVLDAGDAAGRVRAVFSWSYTTLSPPAGELFRTLALYPGPDVSVAAAASLSGREPGETRRLLAELVDAGLVTGTRRGTYAMHDLLRTYATELAHRHDSEPARRSATLRLLDYYTHSAHAATGVLFPEVDAIAIPLAPPAVGARPLRPVARDQASAWLTAEHQGLLAAVLHAAEAGFDTHAWQLAWALNPFLKRQGRRHDRAEIWQTVLPAAERIGDPAVRAHTHLRLANAANLLGRHADARHQTLRALDLHTAAGNRAGQADAHLNLAYLCEREGDPRRALDHAERALALYAAIGHRRNHANALNTVGWYHSLAGDHTGCLSHCTRALTLLEETGDRLGQAST
ncbi:MAG TPA: BTAD domain-containing putative transcriptional regulator, partial [Micromonosporaceae bacterium]|nr:BTAD domain-containing putative transcriptional regulator [Micromonosporaceae bacterium]